MRRLVSSHSQSPNGQPRSNVARAWVLLALMLLPLLGTACSARTLTFEDLAWLFFEDDWLLPAGGGGGMEAENQIGINLISPSPTSNNEPGIDQIEDDLVPTLTPTPEADAEEITATPTPTDETPAAMPTSFGTATHTPTENLSTSTPTLQPTQTATRRLPTATSTWQPPTTTSTAQAATSTPTPQSPSATPTTVPPTATQAACSFSSSASYENTLIALINQERANQGIPAMTTSSQLTAAARQHSRDMACNGFFSHYGSDGSSPFDRMAWSGFSYTAAAENIYAGGGSYNSPQQAFYGWMNSPGHRTNMLNPTYTHIGVGYIYSAGSPYGGYYTANFARP